ncbi:MAG: 50S ribosomal protein L5 [Candidatus Aenigmatarchaeota archaeon]
MRDITVEKIVLNMGCGAKTPIESAKTILERIVNLKIIITKTKRRSTFGMPKDKQIGCKVTIRNDDALLKRLLDAKDYKLSEKNFDVRGNLSFGINEYIDIPDMDYDPKIGVLGLDVCVTLERPGYRVKRKRLARKLGKKHVITKEEAIAFMKEKFGVVIE